MKEGYKATELGDIPENWDLVPIYETRNKSDRYSFTGGPFGSDLKSTDYTPTGVRVIQLQNIGDSKFIDKGDIYTSIKKADELKSCNIYPNDIILAKMAPVARCCKIPDFADRFVMCSDGIRLSVNTKKFDNEFVFQALNSKYFKQKAESQSTGSTRARIGLNDLKLIPIAVPDSLAEQQKIASILSTVDQKIENIDAQTSQTQQLKKGLMQQLLTKGIGHTKFKTSELGDIPESWEVVKLENVAKCFVGIASSATHAYTSEGILLIRNQNIKEGKLSLNDKLFVTREYELQHKTKRLKAGDILTVRTGYPGISAVVPLELANSQSFTTLITRLTSDKLSSEFLCYYINSEKGKSFFLSNQAGNGQQNVGSKTLENLIVPVPSTLEQKKIVMIISKVDDKLQSLQSRKQSYYQLKKGLMQQLLTGRMRVNIPVQEPSLA